MRRSDTRSALDELERYSSPPIRGVKSNGGNKTEQQPSVGGSAEQIDATLISMFITVGAYAVVFPVQFALGLVVMILIHELGHVIAARQKSLPVSAPIFIPFIGELITMKRKSFWPVTSCLSLPILVFFLI
jgi:hypothetical protein